MTPLDRPPKLGVQPAGMVYERMAPQVPVFAARARTLMVVPLGPEAHATMVLPLGSVVMAGGMGAGAVATVLNPGDLVLLSSDGLVEAHDPRAELFGSERLAAAFGAGTTLDECRDSVLAALTAHVAGAPPSDDIALLLLQCAPEFAAAAIRPRPCIGIAEGSCLARQIHHPIGRAE